MALTFELVLLLSIAGVAAETDIDEALTPPVLLPGSPEVDYPDGAPAIEAPVTVEVRLRIGADGHVDRVELVSGAGEPFDRAVLDAVRRFRFRPARHLGVPVAIDVDFSQTFEPPAPEEEAPAPATFEVIVEERGTGTPIPGAVIGVVGDRGGEWTATTDERGRATLGVPAGSAAVRVASAVHRPFLQHERFSAGEHLRVRYLLERETTANPYEAIVVGKRTEILRQTFRDDEIRRIPGTFGDPFRVIDSLPGIHQVSAILPTPVVRGTSPGSTGILLDGVPLPMLYHFLLGPAVIHPELIESVTFHPGAFGSRFGGYIGGIVDSRLDLDDDEPRREVDLSLLNAGALVRQPMPDLGVTATVAARYGYPSAVLSLASSRLSAQYWDYQAVVRGGSKRLGWALLTMGAQDHLQETVEEYGDNPQPGDEPTLRTENLLLAYYHRASARLWHEGGNTAGRYAVTAGVEKTRVAGSGRRAWVLVPHAEWTLKLDETLDILLGIDGQAWKMRGHPMQDADMTVEEEWLAHMADQSGALLNGASFLEVSWRPSERLTLVPGVRGQAYHSRKGTFANVEPRLRGRFQVLQGQTGATWLKVGVGWNHQPPRPFVPLPGAQMPSPEQGLSGAWHSTLGADVRVRDDIEITVQSYFNAFEPLYLDLSVNQLQREVQQPPDALQPTVVEAGTSRPLSTDQPRGRSFGVEAMLRKRDRGRFFGWGSYGIAWAQRWTDGRWRPFDVDRRHLVKAVLGIRLPRQWEIGGRVTYQSGAPVTTIFGTNEGRRRPQWRVDLRIDKRAVWNDWLLDFYIDLANAAVHEQIILPTQDKRVRLFLPTVGFRAIL